MTNEGEVYFALYGDEFDLQEVTRLVGIEPTLTKRKGSPRPKHTVWQVSSGKVEGDVIDVYKMSSELVSRLRPHTQRIADAKQQLGLEAEFQVVLWISTDETTPTPAIGFEQDCISFLNAVGATIDIDTYLTT